MEAISKAVQNIFARESLTFAFIYFFKNLGHWFLHCFIYLPFLQNWKNYKPSITFFLKKKKKQKNTFDNGVKKNNNNSEEKLKFRNEYFWRIPLQIELKRNHKR